jgi:hypothetical protein
MAKQGGLGARFLVGGNDISGDISALDKAEGTLAPLDVTDITQSAHSRIGGLRDGSMAVTEFFDSALAHPVLAALPRTDTLMSFLVPPQAVGSPAACLNAKQVNYDGTRGADGSLIFKTDGTGSGYGLEWAVQLTPGVYTATNALTGQNAGFEGGIGNWAAVTNCAVAESSAQQHTGSDAMSVTSTASGDMVAESCAAGSILTQGFAVVPGQAVSVQAWLRAAVSARTCSAGCHWFTSAGASISTAYGTGAADSSSAWTIESGLLTAPATAAFYSVSVKIAAAAAGSEVDYVDDVVALTLPGSLDTGGSLSFGGQAYLQVPAFTGADATIAIWDSADNVTFAAVSGLAFTTVTAAHAFQRIAIGNTSAIRRYVQAVVTTAGGFTALSASVALVKNTVAGQAF